MDRDNQSIGIPSYERQALRYVRALDSADVDDLALIFEAAEADPELDRLIEEINQAIHEEADLGPLATEARLVHALLRRHLPSGFVDKMETEPLTVGDVAARLTAARRVPAEDRGTHQGLLVSDLPLPAHLTRTAVQGLAKGIAARLSDRYWQRFREAAVTVAMGRAHRQVQLAATRRARAGAASRSATHAPTAVPQSWHRPIDRGGIAEAVRRVYAEAGRDVQMVTAIAPLDELITNYPIRVEEVSKLTYRRAADFLAREVGQTLDVPNEGDQPLAGFLYCLSWAGTLYGCIIVNRDDPIVRRRFSKAHELAHYILHFLPLLDWHAGLPGATVFWEGLVYPNEDESALPSGHRSEVADLEAIVGGVVLDEEAERQANRFAAELLLPETTCRSAVERHRMRFPSAALVRRLASDCLVSQQAARLRLAELGLLDT